MPEMEQSRKPQEAILFLQTTLDMKPIMQALLGSSVTGFILHLSGCLNTRSLRWQSLYILLSKVLEGHLLD